MTSLTKKAGVQYAFDTLGFSESEKRAFLGAVGKAVGGIGKGLWGAAKGVGNAVSNTVAAPIAATGRGVTNFVGKNLGASPQAIQKFQGTIGRGVAKDMASFGLLSGGLEAATADPGDRMGAFARGFGTGALGGAAYKGVANAAKATNFKMMGAQNYKAMGSTANRGVFSRPDLAGTSLGNQVAQRGKSLGAKALIGGVPFAAGTAASMASPILEKSPPTMNSGMQAGMQAAGMQQGLYPQQTYGEYNPY